jgi:hypothetical protein
MVDINNPYQLPQPQSSSSDASSFLSGNALQLLIANVQDVTQAVNNLNVTLKTVFPQQGPTSTTATSGLASLPSQPLGFLEVVLTLSGVSTTVKIPYYNE